MSWPPQSIVTGNNINAWWQKTVWRWTQPFYMFVRLGTIDLALFVNRQSRPKAIATLSHSAHAVGKLHSTLTESDSSVRLYCLITSCSQLLTHHSVFKYLFYVNTRLYLSGSASASGVKSNKLVGARTTSPEHSGSKAFCFKTRIYSLSISALSYCLRQYGEK